MKKVILPLLLSLIYMNVSANTIFVSTVSELKNANEKALPGDIIVLKDGTWSDCKIEISCSGTVAPAPAPVVAPVAPTQDPTKPAVPK